MAQPIIEEISINSANTAGQSFAAPDSNSFAIYAPADARIRVWIGNKQGPGIPAHRFPYLRMCEPFGQLILTWEALANETIVLMHGEDLDTGIRV